MDVSCFLILYKELSEKRRKREQKHAKGRMCSYARAGNMLTGSSFDLFLPRITHGDARFGMFAAVCYRIGDPG